MAKLKVTKRKIEEIETEYDLPVYLYFQDEFCNDTVMKITEDKVITVFQDLSSFGIKVESNYVVEDYVLNRGFTTEEHFNDMYKEYLKSIDEYINK